MKHKVKNIHFVGVGGVGMSAIAEVLHNLGYTITGSDIVSSYNTEHLAKMGIKIFIGHNAANLVCADVVVISSVIDETNPELIKAKQEAIPIVPRAMMLAELMRFKYGIAIAGTHGKTTTTSLCAEVLSSCNLDPTFIIGGKLALSDSNARVGSGEYIVAEADESDASFLYLSPLIAVVTNIDLDHMDTYDHDEEKLKQTFVDFLHRLPFYGLAILCGEDPRVNEIITRVQRPILTYGFSANNNIYAKDIKPQSSTMSFTVCVQNKIKNFEYPIVLNLAGMHNVLNALAVIAIGLECEGKIEDIAKGLANFHGVGRRCQHYPDIQLEGQNSALLIDDYGHHPTEIKATINALKVAYPQSRMVLIFQPHRYTRTRDLFDDFVNVLSNVDQLIVLEVYAASEKPIPLADGRSLVRALRLQGNVNTHFAKDLNDAKDVLNNIVKPNDLVVTMGAGSISKLPNMLLENT